jgi:hypothetical protein
MARPTVFKAKRNGEWVNVDDLRAEKNARPEPPPFPTINVAALPDRATLDPELPFDELFFNYPSVRPYVTLHVDAGTGTRELRVRGCIPPEYRAVAQDILRKYGQAQQKAKQKTKKRRRRRRKNHGGNNGTN